MYRMSPDFIYALILTRSKLGLLNISFRTLYKVMAVDLSQNFVSVQYLKEQID